MFLVPVFLLPLPLGILNPGDAGPRLPLPFFFLTLELLNLGGLGIALLLQKPRGYTTSSGSSMVQLQHLVGLDG